MALLPRLVIAVDVEIDYQERAKEHYCLGEIFRCGILRNRKKKIKKKKDLNIS